MNEQQQKLNEQLLKLKQIVMDPNKLNWLVLLLTLFVGLVQIAVLFLGVAGTVMIALIRWYLLK